MSDLNLSKHPQAFRARSLPIPLRVEFAPEDGEIVTIEGTVRYRSGDAIVTGVKGERWPVPRVKFLTTYEPIPPTQMEQDGLYSKRPREVLALQLSEPTEITLSSQRGVLNGKVGDVIIEHAPGDHAVVAADIFAMTYQIINDQSA